MRNTAWTLRLVGSRVAITIPAWLAHERELLPVVTGRVQAVTDRAIGLRLEGWDDTGDVAWFPLSQVRYIERLDE